MPLEQTAKGMQGFKGSYVEHLPSPLFSEAVVKVKTEPSPFGRGQGEGK